MATDLRLQALVKWVHSLTDFHLDEKTVRPASSDASFRRYFRVNGEKTTFIVMDAPPDKENTAPFIQVANLFKTAGVCVPVVLQADIKQGFLLLSDLGTNTYLSQLNENNATAMYRDAMHALIRIQSISEAGILPEYDRNELLRELNLFPQWYVQKHLKVTLTDKQKADLQKCFDVILASNLAQPQVFVHRDYHSRNLMWLEDKQQNPGILDFQDARFGPITYDLVSLLKDAYIEWDEEKILDWTIRYWENARRVGLPINPNIDEFYKDFEMMGIQRHLKVLGIFARLYHRDGKENYLKDLPLVLKYTNKTVHRYKELAPLARLLDTLQDNPVSVGYTF